MDYQTKEVIQKLIGNSRIKIFEEINEYIHNHYIMDEQFNHGGKKWDYEYKLRKGGKTLCGFYFKEDCLGLMIILGKEQRDLIEKETEKYSKQFVQLYYDATTYHDGKWLMLLLDDLSLFDDIKNLLQLKRKPNKK